ncbi:MAG TPA: valine--tRNA ligase [Candidatus Nanoarchaeia archaeon]|nr:valine--tRNA ligase [Candidatus Nanoarchaeia archaeon]
MADTTDLDSMEKRILKLWEKEKVYKMDSKKKIYSIDTPPPTVSGKMHMGHAFMYSQMDFIARFKRMNGFSVFYPFGTDDNGLPTEKLIENLKGVKSKEMSRKKFISLCLKTLKEILPNFTHDWKKLGISCDYENTYSTIDKNSQFISQKYFLDAYKKGLIFKKEFPALWDVVFQTAVSQAELEDKEMDTFFSTLKFSIKDSKENLLIATTRPELLGACVAVFVNPEDNKNKKFIGRKAIVPLFKHEVPILGDKSADMEKGTGVLMVCSYGDKYDVDAIQRHKLNPRIVLNKNGTLNIKPYDRMKIKEARKKILDDLKSQGLIVEQKQIKHSVNVYEKSGVEIEFLPTEQWFFRILDFRKKLISEPKKIKWLPEHMFKRYENWVNGLDWDWIISRDRHFGVPIPVWYCFECKETILANENELPVDPAETKKICKRCNKPATPEQKVLDTWATSSLTPIIASIPLGNKIKIPYSLRPQGHDIIRTWAFYTIVRALRQENKLPWENIFITGNVTLKGEKMSKSKGNVVEPQEILEKYGADALRYWAASSKLGEDFEYQEKDVVTGRKFVNKMLNATNFVFMNLKDYDFKKPKKLELLDELFMKELNHISYTTTDHFQRYEYSRAKNDVDEFFWRRFCDNYLEIVKKRIYNETGNKKISAQYTLYQSLLTILKLIAPIMPFVTEEIYQKYFRKHEKEKSIHISEWPQSDRRKYLEWAEGDMYKEVLWANRWHLMTDIISRVRGVKTENKKSLNAEIILSLKTKEYGALRELFDDLKSVTNAREIKEGNFNVEFV